MLLTDARFSGVSTGACIGHVGPEELAGGPIGKVLDGDRYGFIWTSRATRGRSTWRARAGGSSLPVKAKQYLPDASRARTLRPTRHCRTTPRLWAALQSASGGAWAGWFMTRSAFSPRSAVLPGNWRPRA